MINRRPSSFLPATNATRLCRMGYVLLLASKQSTAVISPVGMASAPQHVWELVQISTSVSLSPSPFECLLNAVVRALCGQTHTPEECERAVFGTAAILARSLTPSIPSFLHLQLRVCCSQYSSVPAEWQLLTPTENQGRSLA